MSRAWFLVLLGAGSIAAGEPVLVRGRVTSASDGRPLEGAAVTVRDWYDVVGERGVDVDRRRPVCATRTGADGSYALAPRGLDGPVITVSAKGHASVTWREDQGAAGARRDVELPVAGTFTGRALGPDGAPTAHARVFAVEWDALDLEENPDPLAAAADLLWGFGQYDEEIAYRYVAAAVGADGAFRIANADAAKRYAILVASPGFGPSMVEGPLPPGAPLKDLRLDPVTGVRVRVVTEKGVPIVVDEIELRGSARRIVWGGGRDGVYRVAPVGPGVHVLEIRTKSHGEIRHGFTLPPDTRDFETSVLASEGDTVSGIALDTEGLPVAGARVSVQAWDPDAKELRSANVYTDEEGWFAARGQPKGEVWVQVIAPGFQRAPFHLEVARRLDVRLRRARAVRLEVSLPHGIPRRDSPAVATRTLEDGGGPWVTAAATGDGRVTVEGVPLGRAAIRIWTPGAALFEREIVLEKGEGPGTLDPVQLEPVRTVRVRLVDEEGFPIPGLKVHAQFGDLPPVNWQLTERTTDAEGLAVLERHAEGPVTVYIEEGQGRGRERRTIEVPADRATVVDVQAGPRKE